MAFKAWFLMALLCGISTNAHAAGQMNDQDAIKAVIGEAEGESYEGKLAVACAIRNRGTLKGVYGKNAPRVRRHMYSRITAGTAGLAWEASTNMDLCASLIDGAQYWASLKLDQDWKNKMVKQGYHHTATIGGHTFFRKGGKSHENNFNPFIDKHASTGPKCTGAGALRCIVPNRRA